MGLLIVAIFKSLGMVVLMKYSDKAVIVPLPQLFGINLRGLSAATPYLNVSMCSQWYMYDFDSAINEEDKAFFGYNAGLP